MINTSLLCQPSIRRNKLWLLPVLQPLPARPNARPGQSARGERLKGARRRRKQAGLYRRNFSRGIFRPRVSTRWFDVVRLQP